MTPDSPWKRQQRSRAKTKRKRSRTLFGDLDAPVRYCPRCGREAVPELAGEHYSTFRCADQKDCRSIQLSYYDCPTVPGRPRTENDPFTYRVSTIDPIDDETPASFFNLRECRLTKWQFRDALNRWYDHGYERDTLVVERERVVFGD